MQRAALLFERLPGVAGPFTDGDRENTSSQSHRAAKAATGTLVSRNTLARLRGRRLHR